MQNASDTVNDEVAVFLKTQQEFIRNGTKKAIVSLILAMPLKDMDEKYFSILKNAPVIWDTLPVTEGENKGMVRGVLYEEFPDAVHLALVTPEILEYIIKNE